MSTMIRDNGDMFRVLDIYGHTNNGMQKSMLRITSGLKINSAGDDPSNWVISKRMLEQISSIDQADSNAQTDTSLLRVAETAISSTVEILNTLKVRAINSANDHNTDDEREIMQYEAEQLLDQINNNAKTTFNGRELLGDAQEGELLNFHIGGEANFSVQFKLKSMTAKALGLEGLDLSTRESAFEALNYKMPDGTLVASGTTITNENGEKEKVYGMLDEALRRALKQQSMLGAMEERLGFARDNLSTTSENMTAAVSAITDSDVAKEMSQYVKLSILSQSAQYVLSQINKNAATALDLLAPVQ